MVPLCFLRSPQRGARAPKWRRSRPRAMTVVLARRPPPPRELVTETHRAHTAHVRRQRLVLLLENRGRAAVDRANARAQRRRGERIERASKHLLRLVPSRSTPRARTARAHRARHRRRRRVHRPRPRPPPRARVTHRAHRVEESRINNQFIIAIRSRAASALTSLARRVYGFPRRYLRR